MGTLSEPVPLTGLAENFSPIPHITLRGGSRMRSLRNGEGGEEVRDRENTEVRGRTLEELEAQHVELLPERIEMRRWRRNRNRVHGGGFVQDCDQASVNTGVLPINVGGQNAICLVQ